MSRLDSTTDPMDVRILQADYPEVELLRGLYRHEANCQIVHDSALSRGLADPYLLLLDGRVAGYAGIWNRYYPDRLMEFYTLPHARPFTLRIFRELLGASEITGMEAQTNMPVMWAMLQEHGTALVEEKTLFEDRHVTRLDRPAGVFRRAGPNGQETAGDWVIDVDGTIVAAGGFLCHYNPPYGDIYMEVSESARRRGFGSYLVQELKRVCYEAGRKPAARCDPSNHASHRTLEKAGFRPCGRLVAGEI